MELKYLPGFTLTHLKNVFRDTKVSNPDTPVKGETMIILQLGLEEFSISVKEKLPLEAFTDVVHEGFEPKEGFVVMGDNPIVIRQTGVVSIKRMRELIADLFNYLIEEGHRPPVESFLERHQKWLVDVWACRYKKYFKTGSLPDFEDIETMQAIIDSSLILKSVYAVVQR